MKKILYVMTLVVLLAAFALCGCGEAALPDVTNNPSSDGNGTDGGSGGKTSYTITFVVDGETVETQTLNPGDMIKNPTGDYQKEGYTFVGWQRPNGTIVKWNYVSDRKATEDITLTAYYSINSYRISFYYMSDEIGDTQSIEHGTEFTFPTDFVSGTAIEIKGWRERGSDEIISTATATARRNAAFDAVVGLKPYKTISYDGFPTETYYLHDYDYDDAAVTVTLEDGTNYTLSKSEYEVIMPDDFAKEKKNYEITVKIKLEEKAEKKFMVNVIENKHKFSALFIGNSYSDDTIDQSYKVAAALGIEDIEIATLYYPGCTIDQHLEFLNEKPRNYIFRYFKDNGELSTTETDFNKAQLSTMEEGIKFRDWDFIILQQGSRHSGLPASYSNINELVSYVRSKATNPHVRFAFNMTWAYAVGSSNGGFVNYNKNQQTMYDGITNSVKTQIEPNKNIVAIIPNGTAVQNARTSTVGDTLTRDGADHLTYGLGRYIAALTFVSKMVGASETDIESLNYAPSGLTATQIAIAKESAINAIKSPYAVTKSQYAPADESSIVGKTQKQITFSQGYYNSLDTAGNHYKLITNAGNSAQYFATVKFTKADLPVGSVIYIANGWQYRPEGWINGSGVSPRKDNVTTKYVIVTDEWWGSYTERAFNISKVTLVSLAGKDNEISGVFKIYLPN